MSEPGELRRALTVFKEHVEPIDGYTESFGDLVIALNHEVYRHETLAAEHAALVAAVKSLGAFETDRRVKAQYGAGYCRERYFITCDELDALRDALPKETDDGG